MATKLSSTLLLLVVLSILPRISVSTVAQETSRYHHRQLHVNGFDIGKITSSLSGKGCLAMSLILEQTLPTLIPFDNTTTVTIFCPPDTAFFNSKYPQPPFTLLQYHVVPSNLERETLESLLPFESKVDTFLPGHPLVITTLPHSGRASINGVNVKEWDIYNDGRVIVHGVEDFFDPAFQTLLYPWYDGRVTKNEGDSSNSNMETKGLSWVIGAMFLLVMAALAFAGMCLSRAGFFRRPNCQYGDQYGPIGSYDNDIFV